MMTEQSLHDNPRPRDFRRWAERLGERFIPEREFDTYTRERRDRLAADIAASGLSHNHIANGTRLGRKTVSRAARGLDVLATAADRIAYYLKEHTPPKEE